MISCRARLGTMDETWLYHYDPETKQQSIEWRHSDSPRSQKFRVQKSAGKFLASIFGIKTASFSLIIFQKANLSTRSIIHLCWCNWRTFWRKTPLVKSPGVSCSSMTMPRLTGHLQPRRNWPTWAFSILITHPILRIWSPSDYHVFPGLKSNLKWPFFVRRRGHCCRGDLVGRTAFWIFLSSLYTLEQRAKKCIELRGECVE